MPKLLPITLSSLEDGLRSLQNCAQPCIDELKAKLATGISITDEEEAWLDGDAGSFQTSTEKGLPECLQFPFRQ